MSLLRSKKKNLNKIYRLSGSFKKTEDQKNQNNCFTTCIVANGCVSDYNFLIKKLKQADFIICVDGGAKHLCKIKRVPDIIIGDLDSMDKKDRFFFECKNVKFIKYPVEKDATDTELATDFAISMNPDEITYLACTGNRIDHVLSNISMLKRNLDNNILSRLIDENNEIFLINNSIEISGEKGDIISLVPFSQSVAGISSKGLKYPLKNFTMKPGTSVGISNRFVLPDVKITIKKGELLVIKAVD